MLEYFERVMRYGTGDNISLDIQRGTQLLNTIIPSSNYKTTSLVYFKAIYNNEPTGMFSNLCHPSKMVFTMSK